MGRRRQRSRGDRISRRRFLAGGLLGIGGASILGGTQAFSQVDATRGASVQTAGDENALLGVDIVETVKSGTEDQELVTLTNNTDDQLAITIGIENPNQGSLSSTSETLPSGDSTTVFVSMSQDASTGSDALSVAIEASNGADFSVSLLRAVDVLAGPRLLRMVRDRSSSSPVNYVVQFKVENVADFDRVEVSFQNLNVNWASGSSTVNSREGYASYSDWVEPGDTYEITIDVFTTDGSTVLSEAITDVADGENPSGNEDFSDPNDSMLDSFQLEDNTSGGNVLFELEYDVSASDTFQHVEVTFENLGENWSDATKTNSNEPIGSVSYDQWPDTDEYQITVDVVNQNGLVVDSGSITHTSGESDTRTWPE